MPTLQHMFDDMSSVAAQVHCDTISAATKPIPKLRPAVENSSEVFPDFPSIDASKFVIPIVRSVNRKPKSSTVAHPTVQSRVVGSASRVMSAAELAREPEKSTETYKTKYET